MNKNSNQLNNSLLFLTAIVFQFFSISFALAEDRSLSQEEITQILSTLEERSNAISNAEFTLILDGEMPPRFQDESAARDYAKFELQKQFERFGKTLSLDDPITNSKYENNVRVYLNGTQKTEAMRYEYAVFGNNEIAIKVFDTEKERNDLVQCIGRYADYEAYLLLPAEYWSNKESPAKLTVFDRSFYLRSSIPIFFHEVFVENKNHLSITGYELDEQYVLHAESMPDNVISYPFTNFSLYLAKKSLLPERTVGVLIKDGITVSKRETFYENIASANDIVYPSSVLVIHSKQDEFDGEFKESLIENFSVTDIHFNLSNERLLDFTIPKGANVETFHKDLGPLASEINADIPLSEYLGGIF